jgi:putative transposase
VVRVDPRTGLRPLTQSVCRRAVAEAFKFLPGTYRSLEGSLSTFSDLIMTDSTIMKLHDMLAGTFPGVRTNHSPSSLKVHAVLSIRGLGTSSVRITSGNRHDGVVFSVGKWVRDKLLLFDLGYYKFQLFSCIDRNGGFFVSRVKTSSDFEIVADNLPCRGRAVSLVGEKLQSVSKSLLRQNIDVMVRVNFKNRSYGGTRSGNEKTFRVVGIRNDAEKCYHFYITNVPLECIPKLRWSILFPIIAPASLPPSKTEPMCIRKPLWQTGWECYLITVKRSRMIRTGSTTA